MSQEIRRELAHALQRALAEHAGSALGEPEFASEFGMGAGVKEAQLQRAPHFVRKSLQGRAQSQRPIVGLRGGRLLAERLLTSTARLQFPGLTAHEGP